MTAIDSGQLAVETQAHGGNKAGLWYQVLPARVEGHSDADDSHAYKYAGIALRQVAGKNRWL